MKYESRFLPNMWALRLCYKNESIWFGALLSDAVLMQQILGQYFFQYIEFGKFLYKRFTGISWIPYWFCCSECDLTITAKGLQVILIVQKIVLSKGRDFEPFLKAPFSVYNLRMRFLSRWQELSTQLFIALLTEILRLFMISQIILYHQWSSYCCQTTVSSFIHGEGQRAKYCGWNPAKHKRLLFLHGKSTEVSQISIHFLKDLLKDFKISTYFPCPNLFIHFF